MNADRGLSTEHKAKILGDMWNPEYEREAEAKWGETTEWQSARERQNQMTANDWIECRDQMETIEADLAEAMSRGVTAGSSEANALAERLPAELNRWFDTDHEKQLLIVRGYLCDPRLLEHYDKRADGLTQWLVGIVEANAKAHAVTSQQDQ
ncbi:MAG: TipAS antibiotic-recognition domain-containing protein [Actinomycetaceae bacterium]|nr:TipAS antibiotic-recognition domain-containing protein [Actinomycetaceae bacterium]